MGATAVFRQYVTVRCDTPDCQASAELIRFNNVSPMTYPEGWGTVIVGLETRLLCPSHLGRVRRLMGIEPDAAGT